MGARYLILALAATITALLAWAWLRSIDQRSAPTSGMERGDLPPFPGYDFSQPEISFELPKKLTEISGLTDLGDHTVACVQDEIGTVFVVDLRTGKVIRKMPFGPSGDYEGLTRVGDSLWVLQSNGLIIELLMRGGNLNVHRQVQLDLGHEDIEGLGYDPTSKVILIAPKDQLRGSKAERNRRRVFTFDPVSGKQLEALALDTSMARIRDDAERAGIPLPTRTTKGGRVKEHLEVRFSSIAVHPRTHHVYALSAVDGAVMAFDRESRLCAAHFFDGEEMRQVEGLTFLGNGDMVIASEGVNSPGRIQVYRYRQERAR